MHTFSVLTSCMYIISKYEKNGNFFKTINIKILFCTLCYLALSKKVKNESAQNLKLMLAYLVIGE